MLASDFKLLCMFPGVLVVSMKSVLWFRDSFGDDGKRREKVVGTGSREDSTLSNSPRSRGFVEKSFCKLCTSIESLLLLKL